MTCKQQICPECGDKLIHQTKRGQHESSSAFGQHIHNDYRKTFFFFDIDGVIYKLASGILRVVEHKEPGKCLSRGQTSVLPILSFAVDQAIRSGWLHPESGVFVTSSAYPFEVGDVRRVMPVLQLRLGPRRSLNRQQFNQFKTGKPIDEGEEGPVTA